MKYLIPIIIFSILTLDLLTKYYAELNFDIPVSLIENILTFELHKNSGIAFSLPLPSLIQIVLTPVFLGILIYFWRQGKKLLSEHIALAAIFGGALGNFYERVVYGEVTDFIAVWKFPVFNIADMGISIGVFCLIIIEIFHNSLHKKS